MIDDDEPVIGIDLGTTYSVVSIFQNNNPKVIQDELGNKIIPSFIAFENEDKMLVGDMAKTKLGQKYIAVIYDAKRLIGRTYDDPNVIKDKVNWPFQIKADPKTNKPIIVVKPKLNLKKYKKEEIEDFIKKINPNFFDDNKSNISYEMGKGLIFHYSDKVPIFTNR